MLLLFPIITALAAADRWSAAGDDAYTTAAQIIATLFVAIVIEFFTREKVLGDDALDRGLILALVFISWAGLFASMRALFASGNSLTAGLAAAGMTSASTLISLALFERVRATSSPAATLVVFLFLVPPVVLLVIL